MFAEENLIYMSFYRFEENEDLHTHLKTKKKFRRSELESMDQWRRKRKNRLGLGGRRRSEIALESISTECVFEDNKANGYCFDG